MATDGSKLLLCDSIAHGSRIPANYVRPVSDRPNLLDANSSLDVSIPIIDLSDISGPNRRLVIKDIGVACKNDGFFQVKNHGIPEVLIDAMLRVAKEFFMLPESERLKSYSDDPMKTTRLSTSFNVRTEKVANWRDYLRLHCYPLEDFIHEWPSNPPCFR